MQNKLRELLASRLKGLMAQTPTLDTQTKLAIKGTVSQSTVQRILSQDASATIDSVELLAEAFKLKPPGLLLLEEREAAMLKAWAALSKPDQGEVQRYALALAQNHTRPTAPSLDFEVRREVPPAQQVANMRASARPTKPIDDQEQCPSVPTAGPQSLENSSHSPAPRRRTPKG